LSVTLGASDSAELALEVSGELLNLRGSGLLDDVADNDVVCGLRRGLANKINIDIHELNASLGLALNEGDDDGPEGRHSGMIGGLSGNAVLNLRGADGGRASQDRSIEGADDVVELGDDIESHVDTDSRISARLTNGLLGRGNTIQASHGGHATETVDAMGILTATATSGIATGRPHISRSRGASSRGISGGEVDGVAGAAGVLNTFDIGISRAFVTAATRMIGAACDTLKAGRASVRRGRGDNDVAQGHAGAIGGLMGTRDDGLAASRGELAVLGGMEAFSGAGTRSEDGRAVGQGVL